MLVSLILILLRLFYCMQMILCCGVKEMMQYLFLTCCPVVIVSWPASPEIQALAVAENFGLFLIPVLMLLTHL